MVKILDEVMKNLPKDADIEDAVFEGANIVLYTKNKEFFLDNKGVIKEIVDSIKKRVELRADPSVVLDLEDTKKVIEKTLPEDSGKPNIIFDPQRSRVIIESEKPGLAIGKGGDVLKEIRKKTLWTPIVRRIPPMRSQLIENIRQVLYDSSDYRRKFLHKVGKRIYEGWTKDRRDEWVRLTCLGSAREVGRSCFLLQTPESKVLLDCGFNVAAPREHAFPYLDAPEFNIQDLDAVVITHSHIDHCLPPDSLIELADNIIKPIDEVEEGDELVTINWKTGKKEIGRCIKKVRTYTHKEIIKIKTPYYNIEASPNHKFFVSEGMDVKEVEAKDLKEGMIIPCNFDVNNVGINSITLKTEVDYRERLLLPEDAKAYLKNLRIERNLSQAALCAALNKSRNYVHTLENKNKHIYKNTLNQILQFYDINSDIFYSKFGIQKTKLPENLNSNLAQCIGYIAGDGHPATENSIRITEEYRKCLKEYSNIFYETFNYKPEIVKHSDKTKNALVAEICNAGIMKYINSNFSCILKKSPLREVPKQIILSSNDSIAGFIRGFADAEGCVKKNQISIDSTSIKITEQIQFMLNKLGIKTSLSRNRKNGFLKEGFSYRLDIHSANSIRKFASLIGFSHPKKKSKLNRLLYKIADVKNKNDDFIPVSSLDIKNVLRDIGLGSGCGDIILNKDLPRNLFCVYAGSTDKTTKSTAAALDNFLLDRIKLVEKAAVSHDIKQKRLICGLSKERLGKIAGLSIDQISKLENGRNKQLYKKVNDILSSNLYTIRKNIKKTLDRLRFFIGSEVKWQKITRIEKHENKYEYLVDLKVADNSNFIANGVVVHNCGALPFLYKMGFKGATYCTAPCRDISALLCLDLIEIAQKEGNDAPYTVNDVKEFVKHTICLDYEEVSDITPDIRLTLYNAGHTLGSSLAHLHVGNGAHNLVYSLDGSTKIVLLDEDNNPEFTPIGDFIDKQFEDKGGIIIDNGFVQEKLNTKGYGTIAFNKKTLKNEIVNITSFVRHPIKEELYEIKTQTGRSIKVSKAHSVFTAKDGKVISQGVSKLKEGDFILGAKKIPASYKEPMIDLSKYTDSLRIRVDDDEIIKSKIKIHENKFSKLKEADKQIVKQLLFDHYKGMYRKAIRRKYKMHERRVRRIFETLEIKAHPRVKDALPYRIKITKDFARFLGYYISEGSVRKEEQTIEITNYDNAILEDAYEIIKKEFGIEGDLRYKDHAVLFNSKQLKYLLSSVLKCGENAYKKRVPKELLLSNKDIISDFLYGAFSGDGGIRIRDKGREINYGSKSQGLIGDISFMLLQFGIVPTLQYNKSSEMHNLHIYNAEKIAEFLTEININNAQIDKLIESLVLKQNKASFDMRIPIMALSGATQDSISRTPWQNAESCGMRILEDKDLTEDDLKIINSDLLFDKIRSIDKVESTRKYVYDLRIDGYENFLGGEGFLFMHNSGDFNYETSNLLGPANTKFPRVETVIMESTYGTRNDDSPTRKESEDELIKIINEVAEEKGKVLMPVLGVGRSQEIMLILDKAMREKRIPDMPIYVQGMVWDVTAIHTAYPDYLSSRIKKEIFQDDRNPFLSTIFKKIVSQKEMQEVKDAKGPFVVMATSGMLQGGPAMEYFKHFAENPKNALVFTCYQGVGSTGRRIEEGEREINFISGGSKRQETLKILMRISTIKGFSGHSSFKQLVSWVGNLEPKPKKIITIHGDYSRCLELASVLYQQYRVETVAPKNLETIRLR